MINIEELRNFLIKAKPNTYAGESKEISSERPGFKELEYRDGDWYYRDSYCGFFMAPGQEIVRYKDKPVWSMAYAGGMLKDYQNDIEFARKTYSFLKKALLKVEPERPFRGPKNLKEEDFEYIDESEGDIIDFKGTEKILFQGKEVFRQNYIGGLIIGK